MITSTYLERNSFLHKTDPRIKLFLLLFLTISFFLTDQIPVTAVYLLFITVLIILSCGFKEIFIPLKTIYPILIFIIILTPPFHTGGIIYLQIQSFVLLSYNGLEETLRLIVRFTGITSIFFLFFRTTSIDELILSLRWFKLPYNATLIITIALRYIPHMIGIYTNVLDAHKLRKNWNDPQPKGYLAARIKKILPVLVSVLIQSIKTIPTLAMALELKGLGSSRQRSQYFTIHKYYRFSLQFTFLFVIVLTVIAISVL